MDTSFRIPHLREELAQIPPFVTKGRVTEVTGPVIKAALSGAAIGDMVEVERRRIPGLGIRTLLAQVVAFNRQGCVLSPFAETDDVLPGGVITVLSRVLQPALGDFLLGSILNGYGEIIVPAREHPFVSRANSNQQRYVSPLDRAVITRPFTTGVRAIDGLLTLGYGQRIGVFAEPGVGKSSLMGCLARNSSAPVNVIALIGERGREVKELISESIDQDTRSRSVVVVSTSDDAPALRVNAATVAMSVAEHFREKGHDVLFQMDSLSRYVRALREVGLAAGEMPVRQGYPPSVFSALPKLIERAGAWHTGSITALFTVLASQDALDDPIAEEIQGLVDGHILLSSTLSERGHYPAIDVVRSISRLQAKVQPEEAYGAAKVVRRLLSRLDHDRELAMMSGQLDRELERAIEMESEVETFLRQQQREYSSPTDTYRQLRALAAKI